MSTQERITFGIYIPQVLLGYTDILDRVRVAEDVGFDSLWLYDHFYSPGQPDLPSFEGWTLATYILAQTTKLRVGHLVLCNNFRHPVLLGKMASSLDVLSGGRLELGLGSGSIEQEHRSSGLPWGSFPERSERLGESLEILTQMFTGKPVTFSGKHYEVTDMPNLPPPLQRPRPPIHVGGIGVRRTIPIVARYADVWNVPTYGLARWEESEVALEAECQMIGRDPGTIRRSLESILVLAPDQASLEVARAKAQRRFGAEGWGMEAGGFVGTPSMVVDRIGQMIDKGITTFVFFTHDRAEPRTLELFGDQVIPAFT